MSKSFVISDTHFGHKNIITFKDDEGKLTRPFNSVEEMDEYIIQKWNNIVNPDDRVYHLGDFCINRKSIKIAEKLNGRICLIKGNHDIFKLKDYIPYFDDIRAYKSFPENGIIMSHVPIHTNQLQGRWKLNIHGHMHQNVIDDERYLNVCVELTNYEPIDLDIIFKGLNHI